MSIWESVVALSDVMTSPWNRWVILQTTKFGYQHIIVIQHACKNIADTYKNKKKKNLPFTKKNKEYERINKQFFFFFSVSDGQRLDTWVQHFNFYLANWESSGSAKSNSCSGLLFISLSILEQRHGTNKKCEVLENRDPFSSHWGE